MEEDGDVRVDHPTIATGEPTPRAGRGESGSTASARASATATDATPPSPSAPRLRLARTSRSRHVNGRGWMVRQPRNRLAIRGDDSERMRVSSATRGGRDRGLRREEPFLLVDVVGMGAAGGGAAIAKMKIVAKGSEVGELGVGCGAPPRVVKGGGSFVRSRVGSVVRGQRGQLRLQDVAHRDVLRDVCGRRGKGARARSSASRWLSERKRRRDGVDASRVGEFRVGIARGGSHRQEGRRRRRRR